MKKIVFLIILACPSQIKSMVTLNNDILDHVCNNTLNNPMPIEQFLKTINGLYRTCKQFNAILKTESYQNRIKRKLNDYVEQKTNRILIKESSSNPERLKLKTTISSRFLPLLMDLNLKEEGIPMLCFEQILNHYHDKSFCLLSFLKKLLVFKEVQEKIDVPKQDPYGQSMLIEAAQFDHNEIVSCLLECGAAVNFQSKSEETALHKAVRNNNQSVVRTLLDQNNCNSALQNALGETALQLAVSHNYAILSHMLLQHNKTICNYQNNYGNTALHTACNDNFETLVELLMKNNADPNVTNMDQKTPLHYAVFKGNTRIVELLLKNKNKKLKKANPNIQDLRGDTPLHIAASRNLPHIIDLLIFFGGADQNIKNNDNCTPCEEAQARGYDCVWWFLHAKHGLTQSVLESTPYDLAKKHNFIVPEKFDA